MDKTATLSSALKAGKKPLGIFVTLPGAALCKTVASVPGIDWVLIDAEHGDITDKDYFILNNIVASAGASPVIRVPSDEAWMIKRVFDSGAHGIMVPMCHNATIARKVAQGSKYPPVGIRGVGHIGAHFAFGITDSDYEEAANDCLVTMVQIESVEGLQNVDEIAAVPGIDVLFVGPFDLAKQMGVEFGGQEHEAAIAKVLAATKKAGKKSSIFCGSGAQAKKRLEQGFDSATIMQDNDLLFAEVGNQVQAVLQ